ncbi:MAG: hypothetical protein ACLP5H_33030, partial [Desulfomonilaceae bacterium]
RPFKAKIGFKDPIHQAIVAKKLGLDSHKISENRNPFHFAEVSTRILIRTTLDGGTPLSLNSRIAMGRLKAASTLTLSVLPREEKGSLIPLR